MNLCTICNFSKFAAPHGSAGPISFAQEPAGADHQRLPRLALLRRALDRGELLQPRPGVLPRGAAPDRLLAPARPLLSQRPLHLLLHREWPAQEAELPERVVLLPE